MRVILIFIISFFPKVIKNKILSWLGYSIHPDAKLGAASIIWAEELTLGSEASIKPLSFTKTKKLILKERSVISSFTITKCSLVELGEYAKISPFTIIMSAMEDSAVLTLGKHSQIFPFCWIEPGQGVYIGNDTGIGGHTLIFTHGSWSDFLRKGPVKYAPVRIGDNVWLPWRVFIMPGVTIEDDAIIGAGSVLSRDVEAGSLYGGVPAKLIKANVVGEQSSSDKEESAMKIVENFRKNFPKIKVEVNTLSNETQIAFFTEKPTYEEISRASNTGIDLLDYQEKKYHPASGSKLEFYNYVRKYGVRLYLCD